jgi:hypothetical protein
MNITSFIHFKSFLKILEINKNLTDLDPHVRVLFIMEIFMKILKTCQGAPPVTDLTINRK